MMFKPHRSHILESLQVQLAYLMRKKIARRKEEARLELIRIAEEKKKAKLEAERLERQRKKEAHEKRKQELM